MNTKQTWCAKNICDWKWACMGNGKMHARWQAVTSSIVYCSGAGCTKPGQAIHRRIANNTTFVKLAEELRRSGPYNRSWKLQFINSKSYSVVIPINGQFYEGWKNRYPVDNGIRPSYNRPQVASWSCCRSLLQRKTTTMSLKQTR